jgi:hypothetical protein
MDESSGGEQTPEVVDGEIDVPFADEKIRLTANLFAAKGISRHFGGFQQAMNKVGAGDLEAFIAVVRYGLGIRSDAEAKLIEERVFRAGVLRLTAPLTEYVLILANGGKPISDRPPSAAEPAPGKDAA